MPKVGFLPIYLSRFIFGHESDPYGMLVGNLYFLLVKNFTNRNKNKIFWSGRGILV